MTSINIKSTILLDNDEIKKYIIIDIVSPNNFSYEIFGEDIGRKSIFDTLLKDLDPKSELYAQFLSSFTQADYLIMLDVFSAGENNIDNISAESFINNIKEMFNSGRLSQLIATKTTILNQHHDNAEVLSILASAHSGLGQNDEALQLFFEAEKKAPDNFLINFNIGNIYLLQYKYRYAKQYFE